MSGAIPDFPKLSDSNYKEWKTNMKSSLQALVDLGDEELYLFLC